MSEVKKMGRPPWLNQGERRDKAVSVYVTNDELTAINLLGTDYEYAGVSDAIRRAIAFLITTKHPALEKYLRRDLIP